MKTLQLPALLMAAAVLSACGGGSSAPAGAPAASPETSVPASAMASPDAFARFTATLPDGPGSDSREPLSMDGQVAPTSETDEPLPVS